MDVAEKTSNTAESRPSMRRGETQKDGSGFAVLDAFLMVRANEGVAKTAMNTAANRLDLSGHNLSPG
jgi:hypothetical protein